MTDSLQTLGRLEGIPSAITATLDAIDAILRDRGLRQIPAEESAKALLAGARASAALEDSADPEGWEAASVRLSTQLLDLAPMIRTAPGQVIARVHQVLAKGMVSDDALGRVSNDPAVSDRMVGLYGLLSEPTKASALVVAAIAHGELATARPFEAGNGIVARAVEHLVLIQAGVDPRAVLVPEAGHHASGRGYSAALAGYQSATAAGVRDWILHCARALAYGAEVSPLTRRPVRQQQGSPRGPRR